MAKGKKNVIVKSALPKNSTEDISALNSMFEQILGVKNAERDVIIPKIIKIYNILQKYHKLLTLILNFKDFRESLQEYEVWFVEIGEFTKKIETEIPGLELNKTYDEYLVDCLGDINKYPDEELNEFYKKLKGSNIIKTIIITFNNLSKYEAHLSSSENLSDAFIIRDIGVSLAPFTFTKFDLKVIWCMDYLTSQMKKYILSILCHSYSMGMNLYDVVTSPDIDIKKFSRILIENISRMRKQIPRCDDAFNVIEKSVKLLETNFKNYYKNFMEADKPSSMSIIHDFIMDVSMTQKASSRVTIQFKRIVSYLQKNTKNPEDPKIKQLFGLLNTQFSMIDKEKEINPQGFSDEESEPEQQNEPVPDILPEN